MEANNWGLSKSRHATSLNSRFKNVDTIKVKIISATLGAGATEPRGNHWEHIRRVESQVAVLDVVQVNQHNLVELNAARSTHLPQTGDAWRDLQPRLLPVLIALVLRRQRWSRPDQAHITRDHVEKLGKLVQTHASNDAPDRLAARVVPELEFAALGVWHLRAYVVQQLFRVHMHRAKLEAGERLAPVAQPRLPEQHRSW